ncbi:hypothetical protein MP638_000945 [Amoeboaphelidium occidentale]|nr:hypothetical protein MP638_000945 [Amoeboaphelidium occidentale]
MNETTGSYDGKDKSLEYLSELVTKESYDGLIGFSQGAIIGSCMATLCSDAKNLKFAILISGRPARDLQLEKLFTGKCAILSLHVIGEADTIVPKEDSMKLSEHFKDASLLFHSGGHYVPQGKEHHFCVFCESIAQMNAHEQRYGWFSGNRRLPRLGDYKFPEDILSHNQTIESMADMDYWLKICPLLSITPDRCTPVKINAIEIEDDILEFYSTSLRDSGYFMLPPDLLLRAVGAQVFKKLSESVIRLQEAGWHPWFLCMYDEPFIILHHLESFVRKVTKNDQVKCNFDFLAWHVNSLEGDAGFSPHRDRQLDNVKESFTIEDFPKYVTTWIPLTDAVPENGCLYVIPKEYDPGYIDGDLSDTDPMVRALNSHDTNVDHNKNVPFGCSYRGFQNIRALPCSSGSCVVFSHRIIHWGSRSVKGYPHPRIAMAFAFSDPEYEEPYLLNCSLVRESSENSCEYFLPSLQERLGLATGQAISYYKRYNLSRNFMILCHRIFMKFKDLFCERYVKKIRSEYTWYEFTRKAQRSAPLKSKKKPKMEHQEAESNLYSGLDDEALESVAGFDNILEEESRVVASEEITEQEEPKYPSDFLIDLDKVLKENDEEERREYNDKLKELTMKMKENEEIRNMLKSDPALVRDLYKKALEKTYDIKDTSSSVLSDSRPSLQSDLKPKERRIEQSLDYFSSNTFLITSVPLESRPLVYQKMAETIEQRDQETASSAFSRIREVLVTDRSFISVRTLIRRILSGILPRIESPKIFLELSMIVMGIIAKFERQPETGNQDTEVLLRCAKRLNVKVSEKGSRSFLYCVQLFFHEFAFECLSEMVESINIVCSKNGMTDPIELEMKFLESIPTIQWYSMCQLLSIIQDSVPMSLMLLAFVNKIMTMNALVESNVLLYLGCTLMTSISQTIFAPRESWIDTIYQQFEWFDDSWYAIFLMETTVISLRDSAVAVGAVNIEDIHKQLEQELDDELCEDQFEIASTIDCWKREYHSKKSYKSETLLLQKRQADDEEILNPFDMTDFESFEDIEDMASVICNVSLGYPKYAALVAAKTYKEMSTISGKYHRSKNGVPFRKVRKQEIFRKCLVRACQEALGEDPNRMPEFVYRRIRLATTRLLAYIFIYKLISPGLIFERIIPLLLDPSDPISLNIECLLVLLSVTGKVLDEVFGRTKMDNIFGQLLIVRHHENIPDNVKSDIDRLTLGRQVGWILYNSDEAFIM